MERKIPKFVRTDFRKYSKLGVRRKNKQVYRRARGGENKIRKKMKGHTRNVSIGFRNKKSERGLIDGLKPITINHIEDFNKMNSENIGIISKMGNKKKKEILQYALDKNIKINLSAKTFLQKIENKFEESKANRALIKLKKIENDKKAKKEAEKKAKEEKKNEEKEEVKQTETQETKDVMIKEPKTKMTKKDMDTNNYGRGK